MRGRAAALVMALMLAGCETTADPRYALTVPLVGTAGQALGTVSLWESPGGVGMRVAATGVAHGLHGIHVHAVGRCDRPDVRQRRQPLEPGDAACTASTTPPARMPATCPTSAFRPMASATSRWCCPAASLAALADADGSALVIHAAIDDQVTDPSGNSGARIACAVIAAPR